MRKPNKQELKELTQYLIKEQSYDKENAEDCVVGVFPKYITDCPGYTGKVMFVVWSGAPSFYEVFIWDINKNIKQVQQDEGFKRAEASVIL